MFIQVKAHGPYDISNVVKLNVTFQFNKISAKHLSFKTVTE